MMLRFLVIALSSAPVAMAFVAITPSTVMPSTTCLHSKKGDVVDVVVQQHAFAAGSFVEFVEKKRTHIGTIDTVEHKSSGSARYQ